VCLGVEVASSPLATLNDLGPGAIVADFGNNWGAVVGAVLPDWHAREAGIVVETFIGGRQVGRGSVTPRGAPVEALAFAANRAAARGRPLRAGDYVSTGMITGVHDILSGQSARIVFAECGEIRCRMTTAQALDSTTAGAQ